MPRTAFLSSASFAMVLALGAVGAAERPAAGTSPTFTKDINRPRNSAKSLRPLI